ncbi:alpha/beta hydrolase fold-domain-containing protein [Panaeolus papilionaceus]|nr:alpha/beta hydrolase fold-domain-containing protein [Panaeolus papilionaceus]
MSITSVQQPLHSSVLPRLDPEYIEFHNKHIVNIVPPHTLPWDPSLRNAPAVPGGSEPLKVGKVEDFDLPKTKFRAFTPEGSPPEGGWPLCIYFHGGGWTLGNISSETSFATNLCSRAKCVVISIDYRLAPENPYPTAVEDAIDALLWALQNGPEKLGVNLKRIAVAGSSSGGNLATILALKAAEPELALSLPGPIVFQLLVVPVTDNTASVESSKGWAENEHTPWLSPARMLWFRNNYLPNPKDLKNWDASPLFAPDELVKKLPPAWIGVAELDILRQEGVEYGEKLKRNGVDVELKVYKGAPHPIMAMDGEVLNVGKTLVSDAVAALKNHLYP